ncbi:MAG: tetratricopeptide repeat protein, partial [Pseudomonadota bacterium]
MLHGPRCHPTFWLLITTLLTSLTAYAEDEVASTDTAQTALNSPNSPPKMPIPAILPTLVESTTASTPEALLQRLTQYINQQQYDQAYQLASDQLAQLEGDPTFDFNYGFSAAQTGRYNEALFVFERLTSEYPGVPRYRLELARCYYYLGQLDNAESEFRRVQAINPPTQVQQTINLFLDRIAEQRQRFHSNWAAAV